MMEALNIPEDIKPAFEQMMRLAPEVYRDDTQFQRSILLYLKLGGEKLARQRLDVVTRPFCEEFNIVKKRIEEVSETEETVEDEENEDEGEDVEKPDAEKV